MECVPFQTECILSQLNQIKTERCRRFSKNSFTVLGDNNKIKNVLVVYPVQPETKKYITVGTNCDYATLNDALDAVKANGNPASEAERVTIYLKGGETFQGTGYTYYAVHYIDKRQG